MHNDIVFPDKQFFFDWMEKVLPKEDGYPACAHREYQHYVTLDVGNGAGAGLTWNKIHTKYLEDVTSHNSVQQSLGDKGVLVKPLQFSTFVRYKKEYYRNYKIRGSQEDICNCCLRLDSIINSPLFSAEEKAMAKEAKEFHRDKAMEQREAMMRWIRANLPKEEGDVVVENLPADNVEDFKEVQNSRGFAFGTTVELHDYCGNLTTPYFSHVRPNIDYYNSNCSVYAKVHNMDL